MGIVRWVDCLALASILGLGALSQGCSAPKAPAPAAAVAPAGLTLSVNSSLLLDSGATLPLKVAQVSPSLPDTGPFYANLDWGDGVQRPGSILGKDIAGVPPAGALARGGLVQVQLGDLLAKDGTRPLVMDNAAAAGGCQGGTLRLVSSLVTAHVRQDAAYDPFAAGPIASLTFSMDLELGAAASLATISYGLLLEQGGILYVGPLNALDTYLLGPVEQSFADTVDCLGPQQFTQIYPPPSADLPLSYPMVPNFANEQVHFGYYLAASRQGAGDLIVPWRMLNWHVTVNGGTTFGQGEPTQGWSHLSLTDDLGGSEYLTGLGHYWVQQPQILACALVPGLTPGGGSAFANTPVATFSTLPLDPSGSYSATITWGDGYASLASTALGTITSKVPGFFTVLGTHAYGTAPLAGPMSVTVQNAFAATSPLLIRGSVEGGAGRQMGVITLQASEGLDNGSAILFMGAGDADGRYDLQANRGIRSLSMGFTFKCLQGASYLDELGVGIVASQGGFVYRANYQLCPVNGQVVFQGPLAATDFACIFGANSPPHPDFAPTGAPIQFGYTTAHDCDRYQSFAWSVTGFTLEINGTTYGDTTFDDHRWTPLVLVANNLGGASAVAQAARP